MHREKDKDGEESSIEGIEVIFAYFHNVICLPFNNININ